tara:strand:- start:637 stop:897 length:261 start_codon:yes stop_codon:yes gene_type:complete
MSVNRTISSVIHAWDDADFSSYTYDVVYASVDSNALINGSSVFLVATTQLPIKVRALTADTANVYVLGEKKDVAGGSPTLSNYPNP